MCVLLKLIPIVTWRLYTEISRGFIVKLGAYSGAGFICVDASRAGSRDPLRVAVCVCGLSAYVTAGPGICKGVGITVAWAKGRDSSVEEVGLGGLGEGERG